MAYAETIVKLSDLKCLFQGHNQKLMSASKAFGVIVKIIKTKIPRVS